MLFWCIFQERLTCVVLRLTAPGVRHGGIADGGRQGLHLLQASYGGSGQADIALTNVSQQH